MKEMFEEKEISYNLKTVNFFNYPHTNLKHDAK